MNPTLKNHTSDVNDPINNMDFLTRFFNEADILNMPEAQAFIVLPTILADWAEIQFRTKLVWASRRGGAMCWPEAVHSSSRTYATTSAMRDVLQDLRNVRQKAYEIEESTQTFQKYHIPIYL